MWQKVERSAKGINEATVVLSGNASERTLVRCVQEGKHDVPPHLCGMVFGAVHFTMSSTTSKQ